MAKHPKRGGGIFDLFSLGLWGAAAQNSDGTVVGTIGTRLKYGMYILLPFILLIVVFLVIHKSTPMPPAKEHYESCKKNNS